MREKLRYLSHNLASHSIYHNELLSEGSVLGFLLVLRFRLLQKSVSQEGGGREEWEGGGGGEEREGGGGEEWEGGGGGEEREGGGGGEEWEDMPDSSCHPPFSVPRLSHHGQFSSLLPLLLQVLYSPLPREVLTKRWDLIQFGIITILKERGREGGREEGRREGGKGGREKRGREEGRREGGREEGRRKV